MPSYCQNPVLVQGLSPRLRLQQGVVLHVFHLAQLTNLRGGDKCWEDIWLQKDLRSKKVFLLMS